MKKTTQLKHLLASDRLEFLMEAHNGISAKIVEETGFTGIWGSGLTISASLGVRDNNELSWTQVLGMVEFMSDATSIPILLDGDTGYGNFNNVRRLVKKMEAIKVAGVCLEDKLFPKTNSFIGGEQQPLANIDEFCGKIRAGKDAQSDSDFCIVARVEAFIAGWGLQEALKRAHAYAEAGADAILIHSRLSYPKDIKDFMEQWDNRKPIVIVPTKYYDTPTEDIEKFGVSLVIWANHTLRTSVTAMQQTLKKIHVERSLAGVEKKVAPVSEIFRLQNAEEYNTAEEKYLPMQKSVSAVILAASKGENFGKLTDDKPKCMLEISGKTILSTQIETLNNCNIKDISVVVGYKKEVINIPNVTFLKNDEYNNTGILYSYYKAREKMVGPCIISFGDILFKEHILHELLVSEGDIVLSVDTSWWQDKKNRTIDAVVCEFPPSDDYLSERSTLVKRIGEDIKHENAHGEWIGLIKLSTKGSEILRSEFETFFAEDKDAFRKMDITVFFNRLIGRKVDLWAHYSRGHWLNINSIEDIYYADRMKEGNLWQ